jgi:hypothetical protein
MESLPDMKKELNRLRNFKEDLTRFRHMQNKEQLGFLYALASLQDKLVCIRNYDRAEKLKELSS